MALVRMCDRCGKIVREKNMISLLKLPAILRDVDFYSLHQCKEDAEICIACFDEYVVLIKD